MTAVQQQNSRNVGMSPLPTDAQNSMWPMVSTIGGGPLESVMEGDVETDGATTPGSFLQSPLITGTSQRDNSSRSASARKSNQRQQQYREKYFKSPSTPTPPSMDALSLTASTSYLLRTVQKNDHDGDKKDASPSSSPSRSSLASGNSNRSTAGSGSAFELPRRSFRHDVHQQQQDYQRSFESEFREEDDMITLDTQSTFAKPISPTRHHKAQVADESARSSSFFARMEGLLDRVEEQIMEHQSPRRYRYREEASRPSDEIKVSLPVHSCRSPKRIDAKTSFLHGSRPERHCRMLPQTQHPDTPSYSSSDGDEQWTNYTDFDDDSTNVIATQVAERQEPQDQGHRNSAFPTNDFKKPHPLNVLQQRPTQIVIDTAISSPAHTNITMDATMMNETYTTFMGFDEENNDRRNNPNNARAYYDTNNDLDNLSTVTPVLDRYRLDPDDDNSVGVKVVPNQRRPHHKSSKTKSALGATVEKDSTSIQQNQEAHSLSKSMSRPTTPKQTVSLPSFTASDFLSPKAWMSGNVSRTPTSHTPRNKKVYRKTPFPKQKPIFEEDDSNLAALNENDHPNVSQGSSVAAVSPEKSFSSAMGSMSITVPPLRPRSLGMRQKDETLPSSKAQNRSFSAFKAGKKSCAKDDAESATIDHIDKTIARIDQELAAGSTFKTPTEKVDQSSGRMDPVGKSFLNQVKSMPKIEKHAKVTAPKRIAPEEFNSAPNVIRERVTLKEINNALGLLDEYGIFDTKEYRSQPIRFSEKRGCEILKPLSGNEFKSKAILISLCHWQRLSMKRDATDGVMMFTVNSETDRSADLKFRC
jgi:hypothetical protein